MLRSEAHNFQYVFMGGIMGEFLELPLVGNYLRENETILREMGIKDIHSFTLNSVNSAHRNAKKLLEKLRRLFLIHRKKFIIFAHSKACLETLLALKSDFNFFKDAVEKVICVQPPFQGSEVLETKIFRPFLKAWPGLNSLKKDFYTELFKKEIVGHPERHAFLKERVLVIKAFKPRSRDVSWIIRPVHFVMKRTGSASDGLLKLSEQEIPKAEYTEMILEMDHSDLFTSKRLSKKDSAFRRDLMVSLINSHFLVPKI